MALIQGGSSTAGVANVDAGFNLAVALSNDPVHTGGVRNFQENDSGTHTGMPYLKSSETSSDYRLRVGMDTVIFTDTFNATAQNTGLWKYLSTTMTMTQSAGFLNVNAAGTSTVSGNYASLQSWRHFPLIGTAPLAVEFTFQIDRTLITNETFQCGMGIPGAGVDAPDGVWFEMTSSGLFGVIRYNSGTAVKQDLTTSIASLGTNTNHKFVIVVGEREIEYWLDDVLLGEQVIPGPQGQPFITTALPLFIMKYNSGVVASSPNTIIKVGDITATLMDIASQMTWANQMASCGLGMQGLNGGTMGSSQVQWANAALPAAAAATNTTAALGAFLGGIFQMNAPATSATDVIVASWQNPQGGVNQTPRTMKIRGIKVDLVNSVVAVATTPSTFAVALAWGGTQLSLGTVTTDSASFTTNTAKARRIQPIGVISLPIGTVAGGSATPIQFDFEAPLVINPGEYIQVVAKILSGTATATEVLQWIISPNLYHE
jgi:hypothetical protein